LTSLAVLAVDCQTTGAAPDKGSLLELGWLATCGAGPEQTTTDVHSRVVALPHGKTVPPIVTRLTGITPDVLTTAVAADIAWRDLLSATRALAPTDREAVPAIIHYARFEQSFLRPLHSDVTGSSVFPLDVVCTHEVARRLLPGLPRRGLRAVAGYFGFSVKLLRRSAGHVAATAHVWKHLVAALADRGVATWPQLKAWLALPAPKKGAKKYPMPRADRLALPDTPGVYRLLRSNGDILYVGKARSLKKRVNSHFQKESKIKERALEMLSQAQRVEVTETGSPLEAALLEADEIKRHVPPYNVQLREGERHVWFWAPETGDANPTPDPDHPWGPVSSRLSLMPFRALRSALDAPDGHDDDARALAFGLRPGSDRIPEARCFEEGLARFRAEFVAPAQRLGRGTGNVLLWLGAGAWQDAAVAAAGRSHDDAPDWTADLVVLWLRSVTRDAALLARRARWLCRMTDAAVSFREGDGPRRLLLLEAGGITRHETIEEDAELPTPPGFQRARLDRQQSFDIASYDRVRVLTTELRRVTAEGGSAAIRFGPQQPISGARLATALAWV